MDFSKVHHIAIIGTDFEEMKEFYIDKLGFTLLDKHIRPEKNDILFNVGFGEMVLEIFIKEDAPVRPTYPEAKGLRHLAFRVDSVEETVKELTTKGVECEPTRNDTFNGKAMTFFYDPAGTPLEIHE